MSMRKFLVDDIATLKRRWSTWTAAIATVALVAIPEAADRWKDDLSPVVLQFLPQSWGQNAVAIAGFLLVIAAQCIRQKAVFDALRRLFRKGDDDGTQ
ncbi:hypothetical protein PCO31010_02635 [Pandoraea commovens]|uniref:Holin n=2 Tax=Pandoraea commovens TaxID=2508289 RepID=A0A5E4VG12_9BURK|nr:hypothetical protein PCO31010_02635 [Pandoraea commovens]